MNVSPDNEEHREAALLESCFIQTCIACGIPSGSACVIVRNIEVEPDVNVWQAILGLPVPMLSQERARARVKKAGEVFVKLFCEAFGIEGESGAIQFGGEC